MRCRKLAQRGTAAVCSRFNAALSHVDLNYFASSASNRNGLLAETLPSGVRDAQTKLQQHLNAEVPPPPAPECVSSQGSTCASRWPTGLNTQQAVLCEREAAALRDRMEELEEDAPQGLSTHFQPIDQLGSKEMQAAEVSKQRCVVAMGAAGTARHEFRHVWEHSMRPRFHISRKFTKQPAVPSTRIDLS